MSRTGNRTNYERLGWLVAALGAVETRCPARGPLTSKRVAAVSRCPARCIQPESRARDGRRADCHDCLRLLGQRQAKEGQHGRMLRLVSPREVRGKVEPARARARPPGRASLALVLPP